MGTKNLKSFPFVDDRELKGRTKMNRKLSTNEWSSIWKDQVEPLSLWLPFLFPAIFWRLLTLNHFNFSKINKNAEEVKFKVGYLKISAITQFYENYLCNCTLLSSDCLVNFNKTHFLFFFIDNAQADMLHVFQMQNKVTFLYPTTNILSKSVVFVPPKEREKERTVCVLNISYIPF